MAFRSAKNSDAADRPGMKDACASCACHEQRLVETYTSPMTTDELASVDGDEAGRVVPTFFVGFIGIPRRAATALSRGDAGSPFTKSLPAAGYGSKRPLDSAAPGAV